MKSPLTTFAALGLAVALAACAAPAATTPAATVAPTTAAQAAAPTQASAVASPAAGSPETKATLVQPADLPMKGSKDAPVLLLEFSDFQ